MKRSLLGPFFKRYGWWYVPGMLFLVISIRLKTGIPQALGGTYADMNRKNSFIS